MSEGYSALRVSDIPNEEFTLTRLAKLIDDCDEPPNKIIINKYQQSILGGPNNMRQPQWHSFRGILLEVEKSHDTI